MERLRPSDRSFVSDLTDDLDRIEVRDVYELDDVSYRSTNTLPAAPFIADREEQHLLTASPLETGEPRSTWLPVDEQSTANAESGKLAKVAGFVHTYNPATKSGRYRIKKEVARSGPATQTSTSPHPSSKSGFRQRWRLYGWRFGVFLSLIAVLICLVVELIMLICALVLNKPQGNKNGIGVLYVGKCAKVERITNLLAIPLNIIATVLIATSNYVMQCLSAPSRRDLDAAHAAGAFLNIGIPSVHNLVRNFSWRSIVWLVLLLSTIPIHLLLNSAFFGALQANNYGVLIATSDWLEQTPDGYIDWFNGTTPAESGTMVDWRFTNAMQNMVDPNADSAQYQNLTRDECFKRYSTSLQSNTSNVVVVTNDNSGKFSLCPSFISDEQDVSGFVDPMTSWNTRSGVGIYLNPFTGNAIPILDSSYHWTHQSTLPQNTSGGLYVFPGDYNSAHPSIRGVFTSFDYRYWMTIQNLSYDFNNTEVPRAVQFSPAAWLCDPATIVAGQSCTSGKDVKVPDPWRVTPEEFEVDHCLSQVTQEQCQLQYSFIILLIVIGCDVAKIIAMAVALCVTREEPLETIGDAIDSFLERPDPTTKGCCLLDSTLARQLCRDTPWHWRFWGKNGSHAYQQANKTFAERLGNSAIVSQRKVVRWFSVPSRSRWAIFLLLYIILFASSLGVLIIGVRDLHTMGIDDPFQQGFGSINPNAVFAYAGVFSVFASNNTYQVQQTNKEQSLFSDVITVNTPQLLFSMLYFLYNGLFTSMVTALEWSLFASTPKALRVSQPRHGQRSTYWLQLPWKYSLPLLSVSILLHLLVSRSLFIIRINVIGWDGQEQADRDISACGYSPLAILFVILIIVLSLFVMLAVGWQKLDSNIPVCGTNSVAISAACHYDVGDGSKITTKPLRWGVTEAADGQSPGHCSMSDKVIGLPVPGLRYA